MKVRRFARFAFLVCMALLVPLAPGNLAKAAGPDADAENVEFVGQVGGRTNAVAVQGSYAYIGEGPRLTILDISNPASPAVVGGTAHLFGLVSDVAVAGGYAYVAAYDAGLQVVDVSTPSNPTVVYSGGAREGASAVAVAGGYAYVAYARYGLRLVDVSTPANPTEVGGYASAVSTSDVAVAGDYAYVTVMAAFYSGLWVVEVSTHANPTLVGYCRTGAHGVAVAGNYAYVAAGGDLRIVDVSNPANPTIVGEWDTPGWGAVDVDVAGGYAYVAGGSQRCLRVVDVSTPSNPTEVGFRDLRGDAVDVVVSGDYAYIAAQGTWGGMHVVDVSDPANPRLVASPHTPGYYANGVAVSGGYAYLASEVTGLWVFDVSNPTSPNKVGEYKPPGFAMGVAVAGGYAYVVDEQSGYLRVIDVSTPSNPKEVGFYDTPGDSQGVTAAGDYVYIADGDGGLLILRFLPPSSINGRVLEVSGNPIEGVQLTASAEYSATTDASGQYTIPDVPFGTYTLAPTMAGYFWSPVGRSITVPPDATGQDFTGLNVQKAVAPGGIYAVSYGDVLTYTVGLVFPEERALVLYDRVPTYTTYISGSLVPPTGVIYDPSANAISGTLALSATTPTTVSFAVQVEVTGTAESAPLIVNRACVRPAGEGLEECIWSNEVSSYTYVWCTYLPLILKNR